MTQQTNLPAYLHTILLILNVKQGSYKSMNTNFLCFMVLLDEGIEAGSTDYEADTFKEY